MIPDEAVEAALSALFPDRASVSDFTRAVQEPTIRTILEAAAPHLMKASKPRPDVERAISMYTAGESFAKIEAETRVGDTALFRTRRRLHIPDRPQRADGTMRSSATK